MEGTSGKMATPDSPKRGDNIEEAELKTKEDGDDHRLRMDCQHKDGLADDDKLKSDRDHHPRMHCHHHKDDDDGGRGIAKSKDGHGHHLRTDCHRKGDHGGKSKDARDHHPRTACHRHKDDHDRDRDGSEEEEEEEDDGDGDDVDDDDDLVNLGFLETPTDRRLLRSHLFPSKVGGWPAWLSLSPLPTPEQLRCRVCSSPCIFLLQVYAPINRFQRTFHRTIFVFVCRTGSCNRRSSSDNFRVFRSQLPRVNRFYSSQPPSLLPRPPPPSTGTSKPTTTPPPLSEQQQQQNQKPQPSSTSSPSSSSLTTKAQASTTTTTTNTITNTAATTTTTTTNNTAAVAASPDDDDDDDFYGGVADDDDDDVEAPCAVMYQSVCVVCGCAGPKRCGGCLNVTYCDKKHQALDWRFGHKNVCKNRTNRQGVSSRDQPGVLFKEHELVTETEELDSDYHDNSEDDASDGECGGHGDGDGLSNLVKPKPKKTKVRSDDGQLLDRQSMTDLETYARKETTDDKQFLKFRRRIRNDPEQVLRYQLGGEMLWVSTENIPSKDTVPPCSTCGAKRIPEFQVMPQLLSHLGVDLLEDSIDWGTLVIYTCSDSCDIGVKYTQEFLWKQDYSIKPSEN